MTEERRSAANADSFDDEGLEPSRPRAVDRDSRKRVSRFMLPRSHLRRENMLAKELQEPQTTASERVARWAIWASIVGLAVLALTSWPYIRSAWE